MERGTDDGGGAPRGDAGAVSPGGAPDERPSDAGDLGGRRAGGREPRLEGRRRQRGTPIPHLHTRKCHCNCLQLGST